MGAQRRKRQMWAGWGFVIVGIVVAVLTAHDKSLGGIGAGVMGGGAAILFLSWRSPSDQRRHRAIVVVSMGGVVVLVAWFLLLKLATGRHSDARLIGDAIAAAWTISLVVVVARLARRP